MKKTRKEMREKIARWAQDEPRPDEPRFARLRSGDMAQCNEPEPRGLGVRLMVFLALAFALGCGLALAALGDVPERYVPADKFIMCKGRC